MGCRAPGGFFGEVGCPVENIEQQILEFSSRCQEIFNENPLQTSVKRQALLVYVL
jgi:hypothetical protein